ncbi:MAG: DMSO reductase anchor subunit [Parasphingorhabdus sp.]|jgi:DMSO reductase anchor subunit
MNPAFSVIFLTTLIGVGQGLFLALYLTELLFWTNFVEMPPRWFFSIGSAISLLFMISGLAASFFHLGHPERAWRSAAMWRTSWLSREVIVLPVSMALVASYAVLHQIGWPAASVLTLTVGLLTALFCCLLFLCTGMIYACIRFLQEWASPLTVINYALLGSASGFLLASVYALAEFSSMLTIFIYTALGLTLLAGITRGLSLFRNKHLRPKSTPQSAIGIRHRNVVQKSQGFMGGSFNTREFFHGKSASWLKSIKWLFILLVFIIPAVLLLVALQRESILILLPAFIIQYIGLLFERWYFFADANHPQNLYYQSIA